MRSLLAVAAFASVLLIPSVGSASSLFNTGADGDVTAPDISLAGYSGVAHFKLLENSALDSISFYNWVNRPESASSVDWDIESEDGNTIFSSGSNALLTNVLTGTRRTSYDLYQSTFALTTTLDAGDYVLRLSDCSPATAGCGWGVVTTAVGADGQYQPDGFHGQGTFAFSIQGEVASAEAPEPSTWMMLGTALIGFAGVAIRKRRV